MIWFFTKFKKINSPINGILTIGNRAGQKALYAGGVTQSGGELVAMWDSVVKDIAKIIHPTECLMLGLAAGTMLTKLQTAFPKAKLTCVEIDSAMVDVAKNEFSISTKNTTIIVDDAISWCSKNTKQFDVVVVDLYMGRVNPKESRTESFIETLSYLLNQKGVICFNSHFNQKNTGEFEEFLRKIKKYFNEVSIIYSFPLNRVLLLKSPRKYTGKMRNTPQK